MAKKIKDGRLPVPNAANCTMQQLAVWLKVTAGRLQPLGTPELRHVAPQLMMLLDWRDHATVSGRPLESAAWIAVVTRVWIERGEAPGWVGDVLTAIRDSTCKLKERSPKRLIMAPSRDGRKPPWLSIERIVSACVSAEETLTAMNEQERNPGAGWPELDSPNNPESIGPAIRALRHAVQMAQDSLSALSATNQGQRSPIDLSYMRALRWWEVVVDVKRVRWWVERLRRHVKNVPAFQCEALKPIDVQWHTRMRQELDRVMRVIGPHAFDLPAWRGRPAIVAGRLLTQHPTQSEALVEALDRLHALHTAFDERDRGLDLHGVRKTASWIGKHSEGKITGKALSLAATRGVRRFPLKNGSRQYTYDLASVCNYHAFNAAAPRLIKAYQKEMA